MLLRWGSVVVALLLVAAVAEVPGAHAVAAAASLHGLLATAFMAPARGIGARRRILESPLLPEARLTLLEPLDELAAMHARVVVGAAFALVCGLAVALFVSVSASEDFQRLWRSDFGLLMAKSPIAFPAGGPPKHPALSYLVASVCAAFSLTAGYYLRASILVALPHRGAVPVVVSFLLIVIAMRWFVARMDGAHQLAEALRSGWLALALVEAANALASFAAASLIWLRLAEGPGFPLADPEAPAPR